MIVVDGWNVLPADPYLRRTIRRSRRAARVALVARLEPLARKEPLVCVFDGEGEAFELSRVEVRYSGAGIADDLIVALAAEQAGAVTAFTSDRALRARLEALGARVAGARALFARIAGL